MTVLEEPLAEAPKFTMARWSETLANAESDRFAARTVKHLREDPVLWLTTVGTSGLPAPNPVWFLWDGADTVRVFTMAETTRIKNLKQNPRVSVNIAGDSNGVEVTVFTGTAAVDPDAPAADAFPEFVAKYAEWFPRVHQTPESYAGQYVVSLVVKLERIRGF